jgi:hypothetical protein
MSIQAQFPYKPIPLIFAFALAASGCGEGGTSTGTLDLGITDAPVDEAEHVFVQFSGVEIKPANGSSFTVPFLDADDNPITRTIDLLNLQRGLRDLLLEEYVLPAGKYNWMRLQVNAEADGVLDSFIVINGAQHELHVPSGAETGLKINTTFEIIEGAQSDYTIDFDLRKSVHQPEGQTSPYGPVYFLRPTLRLVATDASGSIAGTLDPANAFAAVTTCSTPESYAVYVYSGAGVLPDDVDGLGAEPITTAIVGSDNGYRYRVAYLEAGTYTVAATCQADQDQPRVDDSTTVNFVHAADVTVTSGQETTHNIPSS